MVSTPSKNIESSFRTCGKANAQNAKPRLGDNSYANQARPPHAALPGRAFRARFSCRRQQRAASRRRGGTRHGTALQWQRAPHARRCRSTPPARASRAEGGRPERGRCGAAEHSSPPPLLPRAGRPPPEAPARERRPPPGAARAFPGSGRPRGGGVPSRARTAAGAGPARRPRRSSTARRCADEAGGGATRRALPRRRLPSGEAAARRPRSGASRNRRERPAPRGSARPRRLVVRRVLIFAVGAGSAGGGGARSRGAARRTRGSAEGGGRPQGGSYRAARRGPPAPFLFTRTVCPPAGNNVRAHRADVIAPQRAHAHRPLTPPSLPPACPSRARAGPSPAPRGAPPRSFWNGRGVDVASRTSRRCPRSLAPSKSLSVPRLRPRPPPPPPRGADEAPARSAPPCGPPGPASGHGTGPGPSGGGDVARVGPR